jgi:hypothetical protein
MDLGLLTRDLQPSTTQVLKGAIAGVPVVDDAFFDFAFDRFFAQLPQYAYSKCQSNTGKAIRRVKHTCPQLLTT